MKMIKFTEVTHQWQGTAIMRNAEGKLAEIPLGVASSDKKLKEVGAKELFTDIPKGTITVEVKRLCDVVISYEVDSEEFKKIATVIETPTEIPTPETPETPTAEPQIQE